jgi:hypothetical protein
MNGVTCQNQPPIKINNIGIADAYFSSSNVLNINDYF